MKNFIGWVVVAWASQNTWAATPKLEVLHADGTFLRDQSGAAYMLRGVGASGAFKTPPFTEKMKAADLDPLVEWGVNTIRLGFNWEAFEPKMGEYDEKYLAWFTGLIDEAAARGIRVFIDIHSDAFSRFVMKGCGNGFPEWAVTVGPTVTPDNGPNCKGWGDMQLFDQQVHANYLAFYEGKTPVRGRYMKMLERLTQEYKTRPSVLGFDLINEPYGDWNDKLLPLYTEAEKVIRAVDKSKILFLEPSLGRVALFGVTTSAPLKRPSFGNFVFAPHYYDMQILIAGRMFVDQTEGEIARLAKIGADWKAPVIVGEFSAPFSPYNLTEPEKAASSMEYVEKLYKAFNNNLLSATQWTYVPSWNPKDLDGWNAENVSIVDDKGNLRNFRPRPTAERIAGTPKKMQEVLPKDAVTHSFTLEWENNPAAGETIVFAPKTGKYALFPAGKITSEPKGMICGYTEGEQRVACVSNKPGNHKLTIE